MQESSRNQETNILDCPRDVILAILAKLKTNDLINFSIASKQTLQFANHFTLWQNHVVDSAILSQDEISEMRKEFPILDTKQVYKKIKNFDFLEFTSFMIDCDQGFNVIKNSLDLENQDNMKLLKKTQDVIRIIRAHYEKYLTTWIEQNPKIYEFYNKFYQVEISIQRSEEEIKDLQQKISLLQDYKSTDKRSFFNTQMTLLNIRMNVKNLNIRDAKIRLVEFAEEIAEQYGLTATEFQKIKAIIDPKSSENKLTSLRKNTHIEYLELIKDIKNKFPQDFRYYLTNSSKEWQKQLHFDI